MITKISILAIAFLSLTASTCNKKSNNNTNNDDLKSSKNANSSHSKSNEYTIFIASETQPCDAGIRRMNCMKVKWNKNEKEYSLFYDEIEGFNYEAENEYELIISEEKVKNPPADASSVRYKLVKLVSKTKKSKTNALIKDCPEEKIVNKMPIVSDNPNEKKSIEYYIYKGQRKEIRDFDSEWINKNCNVKVTEVQ